MGQPQSDDSEQARQLTCYTLELWTSGWTKNGQAPKLSLANLDNGTRSTAADETRPARITFPISPQHTSFGEPMRSGPEQTQTGYYLNEWGMGLKPITLGGHTGFASRSPAPGLPEMDGYQTFKALRDLFRTYGRFTKENAQQKNAVQRAIEMRLHIWEEDEHWQVVPNGAEALRRERGEDAPLLFRYTASFLAVRDLTKSEVDQLSLDLFGLPGLDDIMSGLADWANQAFGFLADASSFLAGGVSAIAGAINDISGFVNNITATVNGVIKKTVTAVAPLVAAFKKCANAVRKLRQSLLQLQMPVVKILNFSRYLVSLFCSLKHGANLFSGLFPVAGAWNALQQQIKRC